MLAGDPSYISSGVKQVEPYGIPSGWGVEAWYKSGFRTFFLIYYLSYFYSERFNYSVHSSHVTIARKIPIWMTMDWIEL